MSELGTKPLLLIAVMHDYAARDLADSGVLADLAREYELAFVSSKRLTIDLSAYGPIVSMYQMHPLRLRLYFLTHGLWHMVRKRPFNLTRSYTLRQATFGFDPKTAFAINTLSHLGLARPLALMGRWLLRMTAPRVLPRHLSPMAVVVATSVRSYFADDVIRDAQKWGIRLLAVTNNWDNINGKVFLEEPPYLGVWGEQSFLIARLMHGIPPHRIFIVGSPRFEIYRRFRPTRVEARGRLNLPMNKRVLLFCGVSLPFDEVSLLKELDAAIASGAMPQDLLVMYKPHPIRFGTEALMPFHAGEYKHVVLAPAGNRDLTELEMYPDLLTAADAIISPFSTMIIEGAYKGLPALCLGYNDPAHANWDWDGTAFNLHVYLIRHGDWAVLCERRTDFLPGVARLVSLIGDPVAAAAARASAEMAWATGKYTVAERISAAVRKIAAGENADKSLEAHQRVLANQINPVFSEARLSKE